MIASSLFFLVSGLLAFIQVIFLPGWLALYFLKIDGSFLKRLLVGFGLSLMINYWVLFICVVGHIYTAFTLLVIFLLEAGLFCYIYRYSILELSKQSLYTVSVKCLEKIKNVLNRLEIWVNDEFGDGNNYLFKLTTLVLVIATFTYLGYVLVDNIGTIFKLWDPIVSWNRWAVEWSMNTMPKNTWEYPQLIPMNWSVFYVTIGVPLQYLSKMIMPLFPIGIVLTFLAAGIHKKSWGYIVAIPATILLMRLLNGSEIMATEGYVDTAVAFFSTFSIMSLLWSRENTSKDELFKNILLGALFAVGAAMTKQSGLFIVILYPILAWILVIRKNAELKKKTLKYILFYVGLIVVLVGPFYIYKEISIAARTDTSVVPTIVDLIYGGGKGPLSIISSVLYYLLTKTHGLIIFYVFFLIYACKDVKYRYVIYMVMIPYTLIWAFFLSYDTRNLSLAMPLLGLAAGIGLEQFCIHSKNRLAEYLSRIKIIHCGILLLVLAIVLGPWVSKKITTRQTQDERSMYDSELSILITNYFESHPNDGKILSDFPLIYFLPATKDRVYSPYNDYSPNTSDFKDYFEYDSKPEVAFILAANYTEKAILDDIEKKISGGQFSLIFRHDGFVLVKTNNK